MVHLLVHPGEVRNGIFARHERRPVVATAMGLPPVNPGEGAESCSAGAGVEATEVLRCMVAAPLTARHSVPRARGLLPDHRRFVI